jgi:hypothetical protein
MFSSERPSEKAFRRHRPWSEAQRKVRIQQLQDVGCAGGTGCDRRTQAVVVAVEGLGHDPLRAVGALLLELSGLSSRVLPRRSNVFRLTYRRRMAEDARTPFQQVAERRGRLADELWQEVLVSDNEFTRARLT